MKRKKRITIAIVYLSLISTLVTPALAQAGHPEILGISPATGPEGSQVEITGKNLQEASAVLFGSTGAVFQSVSPEELITLDYLLLATIDAEAAVYITFFWAARARMTASATKSRALAM